MTDRLRPADTPATVVIAARPSRHRPAAVDVRRGQARLAARPDRRTRAAGHRQRVAAPARARRCGDARWTGCPPLVLALHASTTACELRRSRRPAATGERRRPRADGQLAAQSSSATVRGAGRRIPALGSGHLLSLSPRRSPGRATTRPDRRHAGTRARRRRPRRSAARRRAASGAPSHDHRRSRRPAGSTAAAARLIGSHPLHV